MPKKVLLRMTIVFYSDSHAALDIRLFCALTLQWCNPLEAIDIDNDWTYTWVKGINEKYRIDNMSIVLWNL